MSELPLKQISEHVYWMRPGPPDRPSLCAIVGTQHVLMLDAAASADHANLFLDALKVANIVKPRYAVLTHWHWDHVFGAAVLNLPLIAHTLTAERLGVLAGYDWSDAALDQRVLVGEEIAFCADNIKLELPEPRKVEIALPDIIFRDSINFNLGGVTCHVQHVGGDHAHDSCVIHIQPDGVLFLGDCLYDAIYTPVRHYTKARLFPLLDVLYKFPASQYIEGHNPECLTRAEFETMTRKMRVAAALVDRFGTDEQALNAQPEVFRDGDLQDFVLALARGQQLNPK